MLNEVGIIPCTLAFSLDLVSPREPEKRQPLSASTVTASIWSGPRNQRLASNVGEVSGKRSGFLRSGSDDSHRAIPNRTGDRSRSQDKHLFCPRTFPGREEFSLDHEKDQ